MGVQMRTYAVRSQYEVVVSEKSSVSYLYLVKACCIAELNGKQHYITLIIDLLFVILIFPAV